MNTTKTTAIILSLVLIFSIVDSARSDFFGPSEARNALSPDGQLLVRIKTAEATDDSKDPPQHEVSFYEFDSSKDAYIQRSSFQLKGYLSQMLHVSNTGDLIMISLGEKEAICLYSRDGKRIKSWDLKDFLRKEEITACGQTGSTLQWFEEGSFYERVFRFRGPSQRIRALSPPFTVMRGVDEKVTFSASVDVTTAKLAKEEP